MTKKTTARRQAKRPTKRPTNLSLDPEAVARGEEYSRRHQTSLSRLVGDFLRSLPLEAPSPAVSPAVRRLRGVAAGSSGGREEYREHLRRKYGGR